MAQERERAQAHNTTPLSALKDPSSFAPPPKHTGLYSTSDGGATEVSQATITPPSGVSRPLPARPKAAPTAEEPEVTEEEEATRSRPFVVDTTGLSTAHLPKPPVKRVSTLPSTIPAQTSTRQSAVSAVPLNSSLASIAKIKKPGPPLPPRLPPRSAVAGNSPAIPSSPPPSYSLATTSPTAVAKPNTPQQATSLLNQDAVGRLSAAGITVPGFDITSNRKAPNESSIGKDSTNSAMETSELQSRVAALGSQAVGARNINGLATLASKKKPAPPPTKPILPDVVSSAGSSTQDDQLQPPPIPLSTKPR